MAVGGRAIAGGEAVEDRAAHQAECGEIDAGLHAEAAQVEVLDAAGDKPVVFRTIDVGGDKALPYLKHISEEEENPAMGWRALRLALDQEGLMKAQARALLEAAAGRNLNVMFPMVSEPWEFDAAKQVFEAQLEYLAARKKQLPRRPQRDLQLQRQHACHAFRRGRPRRHAW